MYYFEVELDVDGVMADMDGSYGKYISDIIPDFTEEKYIKNWSMPEVEKEYPEAFKRVVALYTDFDFIRTLPRYKGVEEALKLLNEFIQPLGGKIVVHTHIKNENASEARRLWLEDLKRDICVDFEIDICVGALKKTRKNSLIIIEDNVRNLGLSNAKYKFLVRRGHNRYFNESDLGESKQSFVVDSLLDSVKVIIKEFNSGDKGWCYYENK